MKTVGPTFVRRRFSRAIAHLALWAAKWETDIYNVQITTIDGLAQERRNSSGVTSFLH